MKYLLIIFSISVSFFASMSDGYAQRCAIPEHFTARGPCTFIIVKWYEGVRFDGSKKAIKLQCLAWDRMHRERFEICEADVATLSGDTYVDGCLISALYSYSSCIFSAGNPVVARDECISKFKDNLGECRRVVGESPFNIIAEPKRPELPPEALEPKE